MQGDATGGGFWHWVDKGAFGMIYGAITVEGALMAIKAHPEGPVELAVILFGSVLAIVLAKTFAEAVAHAIEAGEPMTRRSFGLAWRHSAPSLVAANVPAALMLAAAAGAMTLELAVSLSEYYCIALLALIGARVGWVLDKSRMSALWGALFAGGVGIALAAVKFLLH